MDNKTPAFQSLWPSFSTFAKRWLERFPEWENDELSNLPLISCVHVLLRQMYLIDSESQLMSRMRLARNRFMIEVIKRDLTNQKTLFDVTEALSFLADSCVQLALDFSHNIQIERYGKPENGDCLIVMGMGKLGGFELNFSSDIDLIFLYGYDGQTQGNAKGKRQSHAEFFTQITRRIIRILSEVTDEGFVFRVDTRLRPNGASGPLALSLGGLEKYFLIQGRDWERYAWIKARTLNWAADPSADQEFHQNLSNLQEIIQPFVYRKYLDFGAIRSLRTLHSQIRKQVKKFETKHPNEINVKLGRGGIREIEFIAQVQQLIRGGREPQFQQTRTIDVLQISLAHDHLTQDDFDKLCGAYYFLRNLEHRLQYVADLQTHTLPEDQQALLAQAKALGFNNINDFKATLDEHMNYVSNFFDNVFGDKQEDEESIELSPPWPGSFRSSFSDPDKAEQRYLSFIKSRHYTCLPDANKERVDILMPSLLAAVSSSGNPDIAWDSCCKFIETISGRGAYLSLLEEYPPARMRVVNMLAASQWAGNFLISHPLLLDELIDAKTLLEPPDLEKWSQDVLEKMNSSVSQHEAPDLERKLDLVREQLHGQQFRILAQDLQGLLSVEKVSDLLSELADRVLELVMKQAWKTIKQRHCDTPSFAIIAYGKLGGKELGYGSDLDLVFLYADSDERAPINYYKLGQRINSWLTTNTVAGKLYEVDYRLRPNGEAGLLVNSLNGFVKYQNHNFGTGAWLWEHQALTRARFCVGDQSIGDNFEQVRKQVLCAARQWADIQNQVSGMRKKMRQANPSQKEWFDIKHDPGGMIDIEFIVQTVVLGYSNDYPELTANMGNIALLKLAGDLNLIHRDLAYEVSDIYRKLRAKQHVLRLAGKEKLSNDDPLVESIQPVKDLWHEVFSV